MSTLNYLTLTDGTLVDLEQDADARVVTIRAGRSLVPADRAIVLTLNAIDAAIFALALASFFPAIQVYLVPPDKDERNTQ